MQKSFFDGANGDKNIATTPRKLRASISALNSPLADDTKPQMADQQFAFAREERDRILQLRQEKNNSDEESDRIWVDGTKVFAFDAEVRKAKKKPKAALLDNTDNIKDFDNDNEDPIALEAVITPSKLNSTRNPSTPSTVKTLNENGAPLSAMKGKRGVKASSTSTPTSAQRKAVSFNKYLEAAPTPSKRMPKVINEENNSDEEFMLTRCRSGDPITFESTVKSTRDKMNDSTTTPEKRVSRSSARHNMLNTPTGYRSSTPKSATLQATPKTPKGRTPDMKLRARQRLAETLNVSDSESSDDGDDGDGEDQDNEDDEEFILESVETPLTVNGDAADKEILPALVSRKESDFDRDVKRRGLIHANVEDYFVDGANALTKSKKATSNNTLASLPTLTRQQFVSALTRIPEKHIKERNELAVLIPTYFPQWNFELSQGYSLLLFGYGSKRNVLAQFKAEYCKTDPAITLNGYMPVVNIVNDLLAKISNAVCGYESVRACNAMTEIYNIAAYFQDPLRQYKHLYILLNNIDGPAMRNEKTQMIISSLIKSCPRGTVRLIATIDHINAPLLWSRQMADEFRWVWKDATTYEPYFVETNYDGMVMVEGDKNKGANGAIHVLRSLNLNARKMFKILAEWQIAAAGGGDDEGEIDGKPTKRRKENEKDEYSDEEDEAVQLRVDTKATKNAAMAYNTFLTKCVENFCVNSQDNFKAQLGEFRDHHIILSKRGYMGEEQLYIPFDTSVIKGLLGQITF